MIIYYDNAFCIKIFKIKTILKEYEMKVALIKLNATYNK